MSHRLLSAAFVLGISALAMAAEPPPAAPATPKPPVRKLEQSGEKLGYKLKVRPGVPDAGATFAVEIELSELLANPHPTYGKRRPIDDADLRVILVAPAPEGKKGKAAPAWAEAHTTTKLADAGVYAATFTPPSSGVYGLYLRGSTTAGPIEYNGALAVGVWPADEAKFPALPNPEPAVLPGDLAAGRALCEARCKKDVPAALPKGAPPSFLESGFAAAMDNAALLRAVVGDVTGLDVMAQANLAAHLRTLHVHIPELFPNAEVVLAQSFTINSYGKDRLAEHKITPTDAQATGTVFVVYKGKGPLRVVRYDDRVARDHLKREDRLGYVLFLDLPGDPKATELALALGPEPTYPIVKLLARDASGGRDAGLNKSLQAFVGLGKFNDPKSLAKGPKGLADKLLPVYLRAAELATMYYADEREFTAFDDEFKK